MVETRIKPYREQVAEQERREEQRRVFRRNQTFGLVDGRGGDSGVVAVSYKSEMDLSAGLVAVVVTEQGPVVSGQ